MPLSSPSELEGDWHSREGGSQWDGWGRAIMQAAVVWATAEDAGRVARQQGEQPPAVDHTLVGTADEVLFYVRYLQPLHCLAPACGGIYGGVCDGSKSVGVCMCTHRRALRFEWGHRGHCT